MGWFVHVVRLSLVVLTLLPPAHATNDAARERQPLLRPVDLSWQDTYVALIKQNEALPQGVRGGQGVVTALRHEETSRDIMIENQDILPSAYQDQVLSRNGMGFHRPYAPAVMAVLADLIIQSRWQDLQIADIGGGFGIGALALVRDFSRVHVTMVDVCKLHVEIMEKLRMGRAERDRLTVVSGNILDPAFTLNQTYNVVILSNILDFYDDASVVKILRQAYRLLAPGGAVVMDHASVRGSRWIRFFSSFFKGYAPVHVQGCGGFWDMRWMHHFTPESLAPLARSVGFQIVTNQYCGGIEACGTTWVAGLNLKEARVHTVLRRP